MCENFVNFFIKLNLFSDYFSKTLTKAKKLGIIYRKEIGCVSKPNKKDGTSQTNYNRRITQLMNKKTVKDIDVKGKKVLVRCDFNVPMKDGVITDENRIIGALPTIKYLMEQGAKVVLCSHMGKPHNVFDDKLELNKKEKAKIAALPEAEQAAATEEALEKAKKDVKKLTLAPVAARLNELLDGKVTFATDVIGDDAKAKNFNIPVCCSDLSHNRNFNTS